MYSIFLKEIKGYFSSLVGYVVVIVLLLICGLFMWILPATNLLDFGFLSMDKFFAFAPWVLLFLIPAITMRMFPDELKSGTIEILLTKPVTEMQIILGKFFASLALVLIALLPTVIYVFSMRFLASEGHTLDTGGILGSYIGLFFLAASFCGIGIFASSLTSNQIVGFLSSMIGCLVLYFGFEAISKIPAFSGGLDYILSAIGLASHYNNISRGVVDTRDIIYFVTVVVLFILATQIVLKKRNWA
ncbi:MAG: gliding motility-associated ABC transporter permease subunit GldF [Chitinophagaceae bacterium]|jgi:ABC-2 type transport system permease protein|nr:gliding motility-associated ABC transporter permease subunit GldF [Chitinophagaceae bacterium]